VTEGEEPLARHGDPIFADHSTLAMTRCPRWLRILFQIIGTLWTLLVDIVYFLRLCLRPSVGLAAENLFLRKQLAFYQERQVKPRRAPDTARFTLVWLSRWFNWRQALAIVQPDTFLRWHRQGFRLFWRWKSQPGRPPIPPELQALIRQMARDNPSWGQERIANELLLKLGLRVSPRTVRKSMPKRMDHGRGEHGDAGGNQENQLESRVPFTCHANPEKPCYARQTATRHLSR
jgi:Homeodomain-like domain